MDTETGVALPFGTFAKHKKEQHKGKSEICVILFDILYLNGGKPRHLSSTWTHSFAEVLLNKPMEERRRLLVENVQVIKHKIELSEMTEIKGSDTEEAGVVLTQLMDKVTWYPCGCIILIR